MTELITLNAGQHFLTLNPVLGGRAISWRIGGVELLASKSDHPIEFGMFVMGPWAGRLKDNTLEFGTTSFTFPATFEDWAIHGTTPSMEWQVANQAATSCTLTCELGPTWPWQGQIVVDWKLSEQELQTTITLSSQSANFPGVVGVHPWFNKKTIHGMASWDIEHARLAERDSSFELSGKFLEVSASHGTFDDAFFSSDGRATIHWGDKVAIEIQQSHEWFVVYDQEPSFTCIEPQTGPPNGINDSVIGSTFVVTPEHPLQQEISWKIIRG